MASTLQSVVASIQMNNCTSLAIVAAVGYDYILTFSDEVEYIWNKPWTRVSTLYLLARYFGLCFLLINSLWGTSFMPGPEKSVQEHFEGEITYVFAQWTALVFLGAAELTMILRVWALYNRSRFTLGTLLTLYTVEIIPNLVWCVLAGTHIETTVDTAQVLDFSVCVWQNGSLIWMEIANAGQIALGSLMCLLVVIQFSKVAVQMYKATKQFHLNRYMTLLVREGMIYFLVILVMSLVGILYDVADIPPGRWWILLELAQYIPPFTLVPRFILGLRALYARDLQGRRGSDIDSAFGLSLGSVHGATSTASAIVFADGGGQNEGEEQGEEIQMVERTGKDHVAGASS